MASHEGMGDRAANGDADDARPAVGNTLPDQAGDVVGRVLKGRPLDPAATAAAGEVGGQTVERGRDLSGVRLPHPAAQAGAVEEHHGRGTPAPGLADAPPEREPTRFGHDATVTGGASPGEWQTARTESAANPRLSSPAWPDSAARTSSTS